MSNRTKNLATQWQQTPEGFYVCAYCWEPIRGKYTIIGNLPYHPPMGPGFGGPTFRLCSAPPPLSRRTRVHPDQLTLGATSA